MVPQPISAALKNRSKTVKPRINVACPKCEVTWRGTLADSCWVCGGPGIEAGAPKVKVG